ncbi:hypothetical protein CWI37_0280p0020 [Hamiltosporidium tvaerminnensis]|uniref:Leucine-rich repeat-containing protein n=1 Tax=Hamiltosporidium tvaerminnensis TaxID=1176355 RepID=A0A4Q9L997_9MICR|nr:hypothetical protein LUQ84_003285 [Hamiltosporidium tvaerminnensis]TBU03531.1 hypothetical protein CWI37_0280p0020 [Hamiltosporidium tvaerminnensis]
MGEEDTYRYMKSSKCMKSNKYERIGGSNCRSVGNIYIMVILFTICGVFSVNVDFIISKNVAYNKYDLDCILCDYMEYLDDEGQYKLCSGYHIGNKECKNEDNEEYKEDGEKNNSKDICSTMNETKDIIYNTPILGNDTIPPVINPNINTNNIKTADFCSAGNDMKKHRSTVTVRIDYDDIKYIKLLYVERIKDMSGSNTIPVYLGDNISYLNLIKFIEMIKYNWLGIKEGIDYLSFYEILKTIKYLKVEEGRGLMALVGGLIRNILGRCVCEEIIADEYRLEKFVWENDFCYYLCLLKGYLYLNECNLEVGNGVVRVFGDLCDERLFFNDEQIGYCNEMCLELYFEDFFYFLRYKSEDEIGFFLWLFGKIGFKKVFFNMGSVGYTGKTWSKKKNETIHFKFESVFNEEFLFKKCSLPLSSNILGSNNNYLSQTFDRRSGVTEPLHVIIPDNEIYFDDNSPNKRPGVTEPLHIIIPDNEIYFDDNSLNKRPGITEPLHVIIPDNEIYFNNDFSQESDFIDREIRYDNFIRIWKQNDIKLETIENIYLFNNFNSEDVPLFLENLQIFFPNFNKLKITDFDFDEEIINIIFRFKIEHLSLLRVSLENLKRKYDFDTNISKTIKKFTFKNSYELPKNILEYFLSSETLQQIKICQIEMMVEIPLRNIIFKEFDTLEKIIITDTSIDESLFTLLLKTKSLKHLNISTSKLQIEIANILSLESIQKNLKVLNLNNIKLSQKSLKTIQLFEKLESLHLSNSLTCEKPIFINFKSFQNILHLDLSSNRNISLSLSQLKTFKNLTSLNLSYCDLPVGFMSFTKDISFTKTLKELYILGNKIDFTDLLIINTFEVLQNLSISFIKESNIYFKDIFKIKSNFTLKRLAIETENISLQDILSFEVFKSLEHLKFFNSNFLSDSFQYENKNLKYLKVLHFESVTASKKDIEILKNIFGNIFIITTGTF